MEKVRNIPESQISILPIKSGNILRLLNELKHTVKTSYGPNSRTKIITNELNGQVKVGSSSALLLNSSLFDVEDSVVKLIVSSVRQHLKVHYDHGLYCLLLCLTLLENGLKCDLNCCLVAQCIRSCFHLAYSSLQSKNSCPIVSNISIQNAKPLISLLSNVLTSKPVLSLNSKQAEHLSVMLLNAYLKCMPRDSFSSTITWPVLHFVPSTGFDDCSLYDGVLLDLHHYTKECIEELFQFSESHKKKHVLVLNISLTVSDLVKSLPCRNDNASIDEKFSAHVLQHFARRIIQSNVSVVFNQKVVSDELKHVFKSKSIVVIDRIGTQPMEALSRVTGTRTLSYIDEDLTLCKGYIDEIALVSLRNKSFIHVKNVTAPAASLIVCYTSHYLEDDLKHVCWAAIGALDSTLKNQVVIKGGGALEKHLIEYIESLYSSPDVFEDLTSLCSRAQLLTCLNCFCSSLKFVQLDNDTSSDVFDCYDSKLNAFAVAVQTACIALEIKYEIRGK